MGAMLRFKEETGKEITDTDGKFSDLCVYLWCCIVSACKRDGVKFDMSLMDFADSVSPEDIVSWNQALKEQISGEPDNGEKKRTSK